MRLLTSVVLAAALATPALAKDRPVTEAERARLVPAVEAQGCTGGKMEWDEDDREFEVDEARCSDGRKYDLKFDAQYRFLRKKLDD